MKIYLTDIKCTKTNLCEKYKDIDNVDSPKFFDYYIDLTNFLNLREKVIIKKNNRWLYLPPIPESTKIKDSVLKEKYNKIKKYFIDNYFKYGITEKSFHKSKIKVMQLKKFKNNNKLYIPLFLLTSDIFGFSVSPKRLSMLKNRDKYPISKYYYMCNKDEDYSFPTEYVKNSRTIGGTFVWPTNSLSDPNCEFNIKRGIDSYIEDRVDYTLNEIRKFYELDYTKFSKDILYKSAIKISPLYIWLKHFETFDKYIEYFKFESFVNKGVPKSIIDNKALNTKNIDYTTKVLRTINNTEDIKSILVNVKKLIETRTKEIEKILFKE